ncbi:MAG: hypothetical protein FJ290_22560 [Planctomycetes bacterium]|nr:hypothetical protein [Planctomycetota bacterium]
MLLEERVRHRAIGANRPDRVYLEEVTLLVVPASVGDQPVVQAVGVAVNVLVVVQAANLFAVGRDGVEVDDRVVGGELAALGGAAGAVGGEDDVPAGAVGRLKVAPVGVVGELAEAGAVEAGFEDVDRLLLAA